MTLISEKNRGMETKFISDELGLPRSTAARHVTAGEG